MSGDDREVEADHPELDWRIKALLIGGAVGALAGVGAAYLYIRNIEEAGEQPQMATRDALQLGVALVALVRQVASMGNK
jgi:hypothetical protein